MAEFYAPWCGHCKKMAPEYMQAAEILDEKGIYLAQIDCTKQQELCQKFNIPGYPSIKVFKNHDLENPKEYQGARSSDNIVEYMLKQSMPAVQIIDSDDRLAEILEDSTLSVIVDNGVEGFNQTFFEIADKLFSDYTFISYPTEDKKLSLYLKDETAEDVPEPIVFTGEAEQLSESKGDYFVKWLNIESIGPFVEIGPDNFAKLHDSMIPLGYLFYNTPEEKEELSELFQKLGKEYHGKINFGSLDAKKYGKHAENLNMKQQFPFFAIHDMVANLKYGLPQLTEEEFENLEDAIVLDKKAIAKLVKDLINGKADPIVKSEPIPVAQKSSVVKVVALNHDKIINDTKKDVLVKYYAPWCGHCKRLAPTFVELGDLLAAENSTKNKFVIAEMDATLNDVASLEIEGYPTIILYPAGKDAEPVTFNAQRELPDFLKFLEINAKNKLNAKKLTGIYEKQVEELKVAAEKAAKDVAEKAAAADEDVEDIEHDEL